MSTMLANKLSYDSKLNLLKLNLIIFVECAQRVASTMNVIRHVYPVVIVPVRWISVDLILTIVLHNKPGFKLKTKDIVSSEESFNSNVLKLHIC